MSREDVISSAALNGLVGFTLFWVGNALAVGLLSILDWWVAVVPAILVWAASVYLASRQFAAGIYSLVADAARSVGVDGR